MKRLFGFRVRDVNCAFKLVKRTVIGQIQLTSNGAMISTELLVKARRQGFRFVEVGVTHFPRTTGNASGAEVKVILHAFRELK